MEELWKEFLGNLKNNDHKLFSILNCANAIIQEPDSIQLVYESENEMCYEAVASNKVSSEIKKKFSDNFDKNLKISAVIEKSEKDVSTTSTTEDSKSPNEEIVEKLRNSDGVKTALELFPGSEFKGVEE